MAKKRRDVATKRDRLWAHECNNTINAPRQFCTFALFSFTLLATNTSIPDYVGRYFGARINMNIFCDLFVHRVCRMNLFGVAEKRNWNEERESARSVVRSDAVSASDAPVIAHGSRQTTYLWLRGGLNLMTSSAKFGDVSQRTCVTTLCAISHADENHLCGRNEFRVVSFFCCCCFLSLFLSSAVRFQSINIFHWEIYFSCETIFSMQHFNLNFSFVYIWP